MDSMILSKTMCSVCVDCKKKNNKNLISLLLTLEAGKHVELCVIVCHFSPLTSQLFITVMDKLRLEIRAMDEVNPQKKCATFTWT